MLPPHEYARAALSAELHVQVAVDRVELPLTTPGDAVVTGRIVQLFRGAPSLLSHPVSFTVDVCRDDDDVEPGGVFWTDPEKLERAAVVEVFLNSREGEFRNASYEVSLLDAPTDSPTMAYTEEMAVNPYPGPTAETYDPDRYQRRMRAYAIASIVGLVVLCWALVRWSS
ncbi:hypothetical protein [Myxococcus stipitatus]|uniref:hypothetical protein n=1 Tax=Myxococcus stipitatus TaxID=83455 RepID=UPI0030CAEBF2